VALLHGHDVKLLHRTIHSGHWDLVCHGHTHAFSSTRQGQTLVLNPGAVSRTRHPSLAVVELPLLEVTEVPL
jgi:predicted phosphodiesterase